MDLSEIRRRVVVAMFSDDILFKRFVLKGGNALNLVYGFGKRTSLDIDLSLEQDFDDPQDSEKRIVYSLKNRFAEIGVTVFDVKFEPRQAIEIPEDQEWGGY
jgi:predicted nucleotidyltransferase component of viral defense system